MARGQAARRDRGRDQGGGTRRRLVPRTGASRSHRPRPPHQLGPHSLLLAPRASDREALRRARRVFADRGDELRDQQVAQLRGRELPRDAPQGPQRGQVHVHRQVPDQELLRRARPQGGQPNRLDSHYLNESSLSNDYYTERALDKFGWIPAKDISTAAYLAEAEGEDYYSPPYSPPGGADGPGFIETLEGSEGDD